MLSRLFKFLIIFGAFIFVMKKCGYHQGCQRFSFLRGTSIHGEGTITKQTRDVGVFTKLSLESSADVEIVQGTTSSVVVETYPNLMEHIETVVEDGTLRIRQKNNTSLSFSGNNGIKIYITNPSYNEIHVRGSGNIVANSKITSPDLNISVAGSGDAKFSDLATTKSEVNITGSGNITIDNGNADNLDISVVGSGDAHLINFPTKTVNAKVTGSGNLSCNATEKYDLRVSGSGEIRYKKTNASVNSHSSGSGSIEVE